MLIFDAFITVAPLVGYYSQYALMRQTNDVGSFSIDMCGILILANILRIGFWFAKGFATNLLVQSFIIIIFQLVILHLCVRLGYKKKEDIHMQGLWRWNTFPPFLWTVLSLGTAVALLTTFMIYMKVHNYGDVLGMISLSIEAMVGIPQLITNQTNRSVEGLSVFMIITWFLGDFLKTLYFIVEQQPFQFVLSGSVQLTVDVLVIIQIIAFKDGATSYQNVIKDEAEAPPKPDDILT